MKLTVYHLKTCDTCRKAIKALDAAGHDLTLIDVRADGVSRDTLERFMDQLGHGLLLNTRSTTWRGLSEAEKANIDNEKALDMISKHPTLMKRPLIEAGTLVTVGWTKDSQSQWI